ncbi:hypothetical protein EDI_067200 [Entamoeba dispar SAW760]|uniref:Uncharacterized protein n=1 Tax=Entamoeba dispar (strain ATCC PRA-260 / SAW760) TaxID=370354 RepID=B0EG01_ENTDS|nr:uncharacterized protein EDI_067200 [Entamoeba dispar SAW760]XP_001739148.1 uncharacterized protein EDI_103770 [Entamoeba dispar SAW760]EDR24470.1 hypothetical protein EDI_103770 [Entamoeba dispar SAW760]EDR26552.1 hypothetical protein EDI_067200 [Entamoeba dispar SAW760]|eukprot:EDR24470.1 hypothetical protein EDI_103770 [Entamoeba dispar SAW760]
MILSLLLFLCVFADKYYVVDDFHSFTYFPINKCTYYDGNYYEYLFNEPALVLSIATYADKLCTIQIENKHKTIDLNQITDSFNNSLQYIHIPSSECTADFKLERITGYTVTVFKNYCVANETEGTVLSTLLINNTNTYVGFAHKINKDKECETYTKYNIISEVGCDRKHNRYYINTTICSEGEIFNGEECICNSYENYQLEEEECVLKLEEDKLKAGQLVSALIVVIVSGLIFVGLVVFATMKKILHRNE